MLMRDRVKNSTFFTREQVCEFVDLAEKSFGVFNVMERKDRAALQYFMREFMYVPIGFIAEGLDRKPWHVNQTVQRLVESAEDCRVPVTMNDSYQAHIEDMDDFSREFYGAKNPELSMVLDEKSKAWIKWNAQKASGWFEDSELEPDPY